MNLYHVTKFSPCFPFTLYRFHTKISTVEPILSSHPRGMAKSPLNTFVSHDRTRLSNSFNLRTRFCKTSTFEASYFNRIVKLWNYVCKLAPPTSFSSPTAFQLFVHKLMSTHLSRVYEINYPCTWTLVPMCPCHS